MLRTLNPQRTLWEAILPEVCLGLPAELEAIDRLLDDPVFFEPYRAHFHATLGRPSVPIETYLRMMFLKFRYRLGFEALCREVADSISWQRFARIPLGGGVPHPTTLMKITTRCGPSAVDALNEALLAKATTAKVLKTNRVRADTTVVQANVEYPSDARLLGKGVAKLARIVGRVRAAGLASRTRTRDRSRSVGRRAHNIAMSLRRRSDEGRAEVQVINAELVAIARAAVREARAVIANARRSIRRSQRRVSGRTVAHLNELERVAGRLERIAAQTHQRVRGIMPPGATRIVSLHDPDARPIAKGRLGKPVEFGYKAQIVDNEDGVVLDHIIEIGNPPDAPMLAPAIGRVAQRIGQTPRAVTADRGYGEAKIDTDLETLGVRRVCIPRKGRPNTTRREIQNRRAFKQMIRWRTGCEGRINCLKRDFACGRTRIDGIHGTRTWCGHAIFTHNLIKIAGLLP
jgi:IS5 family transposase